MKDLLSAALAIVGLMAKAALLVVIMVVSWLVVLFRALQ